MVLADGLGYNWRIAREYFPEALRILGFYHALERVHQVAWLCLPDRPQGGGTPGETARSSWVTAQKEQSLQDGVATVFTALAALPAPAPEAQNYRDETYGYFERNVERMRYQTFLAARYQIGSGVMEATCKAIVHQRLDQSGMHWRPENGDAVVALRANQWSHSPQALRTYCMSRS